MSFVDSIVEQVLRIELGIHHSCVRLLCRTDDEALHDMRIGLRRLRSLLRPIRNLEPVRELDAAAAEVGRLTTPIRDLEVMIIELQRQGLPTWRNHVASAWSRATGWSRTAPPCAG